MIGLNILQTGEFCVPLAQTPKFWFTIGEVSSVSGYTAVLSQDESDPLRFNFTNLPDPSGSFSYTGVLPIPTTSGRYTYAPRVGDLLVNQATLECVAISEVSYQKTVAVPVGEEPVPRDNYTGYLVLERAFEVPVIYDEGEPRDVEVDVSGFLLIPEASLGVGYSLFSATGFNIRSYVPADGNIASFPVSVSSLSVPAGQVVAIEAGETSVLVTPLLSDVVRYVEPEE